MTVIAGGLRTLAIQRAADGLVRLAFRVPDHRHNVLTTAALEDLAAALDLLDADPPRGVVVLSDRPGSFFAGADLERLGEIRKLETAAVVDACDRGRRLFDRLSSASYPTVAVIDGACLGGGLELALACDLRVATSEPHTTLGLPEVTLGLLPGWGGTVRLPRLIGPGPAVELAVSGDSVDAATALRLGIVDACVPAGAALESAVRLLTIRDEDGSVRRRRRRMAEPAPLDPIERDFLQATAAAAIVGRTGGHYPAPIAILEVMLAGLEVDADAAGRLAAEAFARLAATPVAGNLLRVFMVGDRNRRDPGVADAAAGAAPVVARPAVVGAGIMGGGIAARHLRTGFSLALIDIDGQALAAAVPGILDEAAWDPRSRAADRTVAFDHAARLRSATTLAACAGCDLVIESVTERPDVKQRVLAEIEGMVGPDTVITTNTSTNPIGRLAAGLADPARFCGMHFFNPVRRMMLVEVVRGPATSDRTVATVVAHAKRLGKVPVVVRDSPGFLVNRILMPYLHEAGELLREGVPAERIDRVARAFGMPLGPIELYDMVGLDTAFYAGLVLSAAFGDRIEASPVIPALVKAGRLGRKTGAGFYRYAGTGPHARLDGFDDRAGEVIARYAHAARASGDRTIIDRLFLPMLLEALRVLDEGLVRDVGDVDLAVIHALGFPAFRGGLLAWGDSLGAAEVVRRLEPLADLGPRMRPTARLLGHASSGRPFTS